MAVRVRVRARGTGNAVTTVALVNSGYEVEEPEILLPRRLAEYLGLELKAPTARVQVYETSIGVFNLFLIPHAADVHLVDVCRKVEGVNVAVSEAEREVLISDKLAGVLGIQLLDIGAGVWRYVGDPPGRARRSVEPEYW